MRIIQHSPLHSVQDLGRHGWGHLGISSAGAADMLAHCWANWLVDNSATAATLELIGGGFKALFTQPQSFALSGADCNAHLNDQAIYPWQSYQAQAGDQLRLSSPQSGQIAYLSVAGGFQTSLALGSRSYSRRDDLGQVIGASVPTLAKTTPTRSVPRRFIPSYRAELVLDLLVGYQFDQIQGRIEQPLTVTRHSDRMGIRLHAEHPFESPPMEYSESIALGGVQVPPDGQPIVLNRDRQSLGGYPKLGCLTRLSLSALAQCPPGSQVWMQKSDPTEAVRKLAQLREFFGNFA